MLRQPSIHNRFSLSRGSRRRCHGCRNYERRGFSGYQGGVSDAMPLRLCRSHCISNPAERSRQRSCLVYDAGCIFTKLSGNFNDDRWNRSGLQRKYDCRRHYSGAKFSGHFGSPATWFRCIAKLRRSNQRIRNESRFHWWPSALFDVLWRD